MNKQNKQSSKDDTLSFAKESTNTMAFPGQKNNFKLLIVDDENDIHVMTKLVLADYQYADCGLEFLSAYSGKEARTMLTDNPGIACCLLDVVMETKDAGLEVAKFIREELKNSKIRIVLRTGQPGKAPEKDVILNYDINDYKEKTELTTQKLFTTITTALRSYMHLVDLEAKTREIQSKNIRLNEEVARRIVAESNLTKYNRSLERMIESKTQRLKEALNSLKSTEKELFTTQKTSIVSDLSVASIATMDSSNTLVDSNLKKMNQYRQQMTFLLEKYNTLEQIITNHKGTRQDLELSTQKSVKEICEYKNKIDMETLLKKYPEIIEDSLKGIQQISKAVSDIKLFAAISDENWQKIDINSLLKELAEHWKGSDKHIDFQLDLQDIPVVKLPGTNIEKAIQEIIDNALQAVTSRGIISIGTRYEDPCIHIIISDLGIGIPQETLPHIFTPYFSAWKQSKKGLGLSFTKSVVLSCGGDIKITSTMNEGTTATLCLPADK